MHNVDILNICMKVYGAKMIFVVSDKRKYVHKVLVNSLFKLAQEKVWLGELTVPP